MNLLSVAEVLYFSLPDNDVDIYITNDVVTRPQVYSFTGCQ